MKTRYVLGIVIDPATGFVVGITKKKGPAFLLGKVTFPGGKLEGNESAQAAMTRELAEEAGIDVPERDWRVLSYSETDDYTLTKLVAESSKVLHARTREQEPIWHLAIKSHLRFAATQPNQYAPDFLADLTQALAVLNPVPVAVTA